jgi:hypothetical protein
MLDRTERTDDPSSIDPPETGSSPAVETPEGDPSGAGAIDPPETGVGQ